MKTVEAIAPPRWCCDCGMDLILSDNPVVLDDEKTMCDICSNRTQTRIGGEQPRMQTVLNIKQKLKDMEEELEDIEGEIEGLENEARDIKRQIRELETQLQEA